MNPLVEKAIEIASIWHDETYRKARWREDTGAMMGETNAPISVPVIQHVVSVGMYLQKEGWDDTTVAAGILHDIIEDKNRHKRRMTADQLSHLIGNKVTALVMFVSEDKLDSDGVGRTWQDRKDGYLKKLQQAPVEALAISLADKWHNLWTMNRSLATGVDIFASGKNRKKLSAGPESQTWFFESVLDIARNNGDIRLNAFIEAIETELADFRRRFRV